MPIVPPAPACAAPPVLAPALTVPALPAVVLGPPALAPPAPAPTIGLPAPPGLPAVPGESSLELEQATPMSPRAATQRTNDERASFCMFLWGITVNPWAECQKYSL
jgi:hypothetical protein